MFNPVKSYSEFENLKKEFTSALDVRFTSYKGNEKAILVCGETGCRSSGSLALLDTLKEELGERKDVQIVQTGCIGSCELGPVVMVYPEGVLYVSMTQDKVKRMIKEHIDGGKVIEEYLFKDLGSGKVYHLLEEIPFFSRQRKFIRRFAGVIDPELIEEYIAAGGYEGLVRAVSSLQPDNVIEEVKASGLRGRGGAGFPTGLKWSFTAKSEASNGHKYVVCNADEGDPGAFMDRSQLEGDPHSIIEGMALCGYAIGANHGYVYCRAEYPLAIERLEEAIQQAEAAGLLGDHIAGSDFSFHLDIRMGAGAFVCGEETALLNSIEGKRGEPRPKPPFPAKSGVWKSPTVVNNVETFGNIPRIIREGAANFAAIGSEGSKGTKVFALAGAVKNVGLIEVPMGISLGEIVYDIGGGILNNKEFKAVQIGGPSGGCLPKNKLNIKIDYESLKEAGAMMGSGGLIVMNEDTCMVDLAKFFMEFIQDESCGKCPPCRIGTRKMLEILNRISEGKGKEEDIDELIRLGEDIKASSVCGLGQTAPNPVLSTIHNFRDEYMEHIKDKHCTAGVCTELVYAPCSNACPAGVDVPGFVALTKEKRYDEALALHLERNPFPMACGMTCPHPCETKCRRSVMDAPLAIREIKRYMTTKAGNNGIYPMPEAMSRNASEKKSIGIIGGGPGGLTAAYFLKRLGHDVTIYEAQDELGGMLRYGIPEYRYPKEILNNEISNIIGMGVTVKTNCLIGETLLFDDVKKSHDASVIAVGGWKSMKLGLDGEDAQGVLGGTDFLWLVAHGDMKTVEGKVFIIGGGNTAIDAARTAIRLGAEEVTLAYRRTIDQMPAEEEEILELIEEGVNPVILTNIEEIITENGTLKGIKCRKQSLGDFDLSGRKRPIPLEGDEHTVVFDCDYLIPAISQDIDLSFAPELKKNPNGTLYINEETYQTSDETVWGCGDVTSLTYLVTAIAHGEEVACQMEQALNKERAASFPWKERKPIDVFFDPEADPVEENRVATEYSSVEERIKNFLVVNRGVNWESAITKEASRCLRCDYRETVE